MNVSPTPRRPHRTPADVVADTLAVLALHGRALVATRLRGKFDGRPVYRVVSVARAAATARRQNLSAAPVFLIVESEGPARMVPGVVVNALRDQLETVHTEDGPVLRLRGPVPMWSDLPLFTGRAA